MNIDISNAIVSMLAVFKENIFAVVMNNISFVILMASMSIIIGVVWNMLLKKLRWY